MSKAPALAQLLHSAGFSWNVADDITGAVESLGIRGARSDDLAAALFRWRDQCVAGAKKELRKKAGRILRGNGTDETVDDLVRLDEGELDPEGQQLLFDTADERNRFLKASTPQAEGR